MDAAAGRIAVGLATLRRRLPLWLLTVAVRRVRRPETQRHRPRLVPEALSRHTMGRLKTLAAEVIDGDEEMGFELAAFLVGSGSETWKGGKQKPRLCDHVYAQQRHPVNRISGASAILRKCLNGCLRPSDMAEVCAYFRDRFFFRVH